MRKILKKKLCAQHIFPSIKLLRQEWKRSFSLLSELRINSKQKKLLFGRSFYLKFQESSRCFVSMFPCFPINVFILAAAPPQLLSCDYYRGSKWNFSQLPHSVVTLWAFLVSLEYDRSLVSVISTHGSHIGYKIDSASSRTNSRWLNHSHFANTQHCAAIICAFDFDLEVKTKSNIEY